MRTVAGIDSHKDTLAVAIVDQRGRQQHACTVVNSPEGFVRLTAHLVEHDVDVVGIEGSGGYGRPVALHLQRQAVTVVEVPPQMTAGSRRGQRSNAKTDQIDALLIARIVLREPQLPLPRPDDAREDIRVLVRYRRELLKERNRFSNRLHADLEQLHPGYQQRIGRLTTARNLDRARRLLAGDATPRALVARSRVTRLKQLTGEIDTLTDDIRQRGRALDRSLVTIPGIAELTAAELLAEVGDISRFRTRNQFAMANGTAPVPVSSGRTDRHRLNRGGNRQLNRIIHFIALTQASRDPAGRAYYQRKQADGKTKREALRCLKRRISDRIYRTLTAAAT